MRRFTGPLGKIAQRFFSTRAFMAEAQPGAARPAAAKPLAMTFRAAEDAMAAAEQLFAHARKIEDCLSDIREDVGLAWQEQSRASQEYYDLARGILLALDDLRDLAASQPGISDLAARLEGLLRQQDIVMIPVATGDAFCAGLRLPGAFAATARLEQKLAFGQGRAKPRSAGTAFGSKDAAAARRSGARRRRPFA